MTRYGGLSHLQVELMDLLDGVFGGERACTKATGVPLDEVRFPVASELVEKGLVEMAVEGTPRYWLPASGVRVCADLALHREYNRRAPPGWRY